MSNGPAEPWSDLRRRLGVAFLVAWTPLVAFGVGSLMVGHLAPLPAPVVDAASAGEALGVARERRSDLAVVHLLDVD